MPAPDPLAPFIEPLERLGLPYCITGSVAASVYGEPRLTADIDIVLVLQQRDIPKLQSAFPEAGYFLRPTEVMRKLEFLREGGSDKHVRDIRYILAATAVDQAFIDTEVGRRDLHAQWLRMAQS